MSLLTTLQAANDTAAIESFAFANIQEFQSFMDSFGFTTYPANVIVPPQYNGSLGNGRNNVIVNISGWVIKRIPEDTNDFRSILIEDTYIAPMRAKAILFINALLDSDIIDPEVEDVAWTVKPEYALLPAHVFGVSYTINLPILESICKTA